MLFLLDNKDLKEKRSRVCTAMINLERGQTHATSPAREDERRAFVTRSVSLLLLSLPAPPLPPPTARRNSQDDVARSYFEVSVFRPLSEKLCYQKEIADENIRENGCGERANKSVLENTRCPPPPCPSAGRYSCPGR